jgi:hypothetical protein
LSVSGEGNFFLDVPEPARFEPKNTIGLFSFPGSMGMNPLACPSRSRPNPPISVPNSSTAGRTSQSMGEPKEEAKGFRASLFILVTPLLGLRALPCVEHCAGEEGAAFADQLTPAFVHVETISIKPS